MWFCFELRHFFYSDIKELQLVTVSFASRTDGSLPSDLYLFFQVVKLNQDFAGIPSRNAPTGYTITKRVKATVPGRRSLPSRTDDVDDVMRQGTVVDDDVSSGEEQLAELRRKVAIFALF